jgi:hypothetical protein
MSVTAPMSESPGLAHPGGLCFFCGTPLSNPAVQWMGATGGRRPSRLAGAAPMARRIQSPIPESIEGRSSHV